jgi:hypothetical protein
METLGKFIGGLIGLTLRGATYALGAWLILYLLGSPW